MSAPGYRTRLEILFAREAAKAVILRRGPRTHFHLIAWDLAGDRFEHGQWMKGHVRLCDLSPDGDRLLYWAHQYHASARWRRQSVLSVDGPAGYEPLRQRDRLRSPRKGELKRRTPRYLRGSATGVALQPRSNSGVWTALSRPPYFTALALWPSFGHWTGGGYFVSRDHVALGESADGLTPRLLAPPPANFRTSQAGGEGLARPLGQAELEDWGQAAPEEAPAARRAGLAPIVAGLRGSGARWIEFVSPRPDGDLLFACDGRVHRLADWRSVAPERRLAEARVLLDLNGLSFTLVPPPPEALCW